MYYSITGTLAACDQSTVVIDANGVAYEIMVPFTTFESLPEQGSTITLYTRLIVRENDMYLTGFSNIENRRLFDTLSTVSGIGPKQALKILSELSAGQIRNAIISGDSALLSKVKGIGPKTASRIILELKDKMKKLNITSAESDAPAEDRRQFEALMAMRVLGYNDSESNRAIDSVFSDRENIENLDVEDIIKLVLSAVAK